MAASVCSREGTRSIKCTVTETPAKMGSASDAASVVDARLRFHGIAALRIADASVMPTITSGNTNTPTAMIAEKGAAMVLEDARASHLSWRGD